MEKYNVTPIIKETNQWSIKNDETMSIKDVTETYLNKNVTDGIDDLYVTNIKFTPIHLIPGDYLIELINDESDAISFLNI
jgi:hypothetical protein